jgi:hypothetical protein
MEEEFVEHYQKNQKDKINEEESEEFKKIEQLRGIPMTIGTL